jgi:hypothetical protein
MQGGDFLEKTRLGACDVLDRLAGNGIGEEADEIAGVTGFECDADFAVGLESPNPRAVPGARVDDDERPSRRVDLGARRRNDPHEPVVDGSIKRLAAEDQLHFVVEHIWHGLGQVFAILIAALAHDVPEQNAALRGIDHVLHGRSKYAERRKRVDRRWLLLAGWHGVCSLHYIR